MATPNRIYVKLGLTGGGATDLDGIDGDKLIDGDIGIYQNQGSSEISFYWLDDDSGAAESSPTIIAPDANPGDKRWLRLTPVP
jgi:hypothetical protein